MNNKTFLYLVVGFLVFGGALGGAFVGGIAVGGGNDDSPTVATSNLPAVPNAQQTQQAQAFQGDFNSLREQFQSGNLSPEELTQLRQQFQGGGGDGQFRPGGFQRGDGGDFNFGGDGAFAGVAPVSGTIASISDNTVTITTDEGQLVAAVADDTVIRDLSSLSISDLFQGMTIAVIGEPDENGVVQAASILITPDGTDANAGFGGRFSPFGDGQRRPQNPN